MTEFMGLAEKVSKFNQEALKHIERQTLNPFSGRFSRSPSPRPKFSKDEYGKPAAGSLTEMRGQRAFTQISREILELCEVIHDMGARRRDSDGDECIIIPFGELFAFYTKISDKVVGLLIAAKKRGFVWFEPEILFQRRDDDVLIALIKPIGEIRNIVSRQISASPSPAPAAPSETEKTSPSPTPSPLARQDSNPSSEASSTPAKPEKPLPYLISATSIEEEPTPSSSTEENIPETPTAVIVEKDQNSSNSGSLGPGEEEKKSSPKAPVVDTVVELNQAPVSETPVIVEQNSSITIEEPSTDNKEIPPSNETPHLPEGLSEGEQISALTTFVGVEQTIHLSEPIAPTKEETIVEPVASPEEKTFVEPVASPEEEPIVESVSPEDHDSLSLKIYVAVDQDPTSVTKEPGLVSPCSEVEQASLSSEVPVIVTDETPSSIAQVAPDDNEQATPSPTTTTETDQTLPSSHKNEGIAPSSENEQTPPSIDTGEKTVA